MKTLLLATVALAALAAGEAAAADLAARSYTKAPAQVFAAYNWSGFYMGVNGGYGWANKCADYAGTTGAPLAANVFDGCHKATGGVAGGQIGYNWQTGGWVFGLEAQGDWANLRGANIGIVPAGIDPLTSSTTINALGFFTGRLGYAWDNSLLYVKGGAAASRNKYESQIAATGVSYATANETRWGAAVGAGVEFGLTPNWSFGVEYTHAFLGARDVTFTPSPIGAAVVDRIKQDVDLVTARINYRFGGPVVARY
jgi:outer membrane immunogenic protein